MSALFWNNHQRRVGPGFSIGDVKNGVADVLRQLRFTDIRHTELEVAGNRDGCVLSVGHFRSGERDFWEVTICGGSDGAITQRTRDEVVKKLIDMRFL